MRDSWNNINFPLQILSKFYLVSKYDERTDFQYLHVIWPWIIRCKTLYSTSFSSIAEDSSAPDVMKKNGLRISREKSNLNAKSDFVMPPIHLGINADLTAEKPVNKVSIKISWVLGAFQKRS